MWTGKAHGHSMERTKGDDALASSASWSLRSTSAVRYCLWRADANSVLLFWLKLLQAGNNKDGYVIVLMSVDDPLHCCVGFCIFVSIGSRDAFMSVPTPCSCILNIWRAFSHPLIYLFISYSLQIRLQSFKTLARLLPKQNTVLSSISKKSQMHHSSAPNWKNHPKMMFFFFCKKYGSIFHPSLHFKNFIHEVSPVILILITVISPFFTSCCFFVPHELIVTVKRMCFSLIKFIIMLQCFSLKDIECPWFKHSNINYTDGYI